MNYQEAVEQVKVQKSYHENEVCIHNMEWQKKRVEALDMAVSALESMPEYERLKERDAAKKPRGLSINTENMRLGNCPNCNKLLTDKYDKHHCECGQRIDWTEQEEEHEK